MKRTLFAVLLLLAAAVGFFLPDVASLIVDNTFAYRSTASRTSAVSINYSFNLSLLEKASLLTSYSPEYTQQLEGGLALTETSAIASAEKFLREIAFETIVFSNTYATPYISMFSGGQNLLLWEVNVQFGTWVGNLYLDDATGAVLSLNLCDTMFPGTSPFLSADESQTPSLVEKVTSAIAKQLKAEHYSVNDLDSFKVLIMTDDTIEVNLPIVCNDSSLSTRNY